MTDTPPPLSDSQRASIEYCDGNGFFDEVNKALSTVKEKWPSNAIPDRVDAWRFNGGDVVDGELTTPGVDLVFERTRNSDRDPHLLNQARKNRIEDQVQNVREALLTAMAMMKGEGRLNEMELGTNMYSYLPPVFSKKYEGKDCLVIHIPTSVVQATKNDKDFANHCLTTGLMGACSLNEARGR